MMPQKLRIGWFSFTCCEDSSILFTELLNEHFFEWKEKIDFAHVKMLKSENDMSNLDVAFVEGAISGEDQKEELLEIRKNCKKLVAIGACAITCKPSGNRNDFPEEILKKYHDVFETFNYSDKVQKLSDIVTVDDQVIGCPMNPTLFLQKLDSYLQEFKGMT